MKTKRQSITVRGATIFPIKSDTEYLRDLAERLMRVPVMYGTDQGDVSRLCEIARKLERQNLSNKSEA